jgi:hypothetical protein
VGSLLKIFTLIHSYLAQEVSRDILDQLALAENKALLVKRVIQAKKVSRAPLAHKAHKVRQAHKAKKEPRVPQVSKEFKVLQAYKVLLENKAQEV